MISIDSDYTVARLQAMVRIASFNPTLAEGGEGEHEIAAWLAAECAALGFMVELQEVLPGRPNVIARRAGTGGGRSLMLTGHMDTVSGIDMALDPLAGNIHHSLLYGRGAQDMKGGIAAVLGAAHALQDQTFAGELILAFVIDEEYASLGAAALVELIHPDAAILTEPTDERVCIAHKGFAWLMLETHGRAAHGSLFATGIDAIAHMGRLIAVMETLERERFPLRTHPLLGRASVHASLISGGIGLSTYPDHCVMQVEHRLLPDEHAEDIRDLWQSEIDHLHEQDRAFDANVKLDLSRPGYEINRNAPIVTTLVGALRAVTAAEPEYWGMAAWMDSAIFSRAGIPTVIYGPRGFGMHGAEEYVEVESVTRCAAVIAESAARWLRETVA